MIGGDGFGSCDDGKFLNGSSPQLRVIAKQAVIGPSEVSKNTLNHSHFPPVISTRFPLDIDLYFSPLTNIMEPFPPTLLPPLLFQGRVFKENPYPITQPLLERYQR